MKRTDKKGFTIVELVIVIAVIAILAAVLIPNISRLVQKANASADESLVRNLNTALSMDVEKHTTMSAALKAAKDNGGYDLETIELKGKGNKILWDSVNDCFVYLKGNDRVYLPNTQSVKKANDMKDYEYFEILETMPEDMSEQKYSIYLAGENYDQAVTVTVGFDAGENTMIPSVTYNRASETTKQSVVLNTNGGAVVINAPMDDVNRYGNADSVKIEAVASTSYHEFGKVVGDIEIVKGRIEIAASAEVNTIFVSSAVENDVKVDIVSGAKHGIVAPTTNAAKVDVANSSSIPEGSKSNDVLTINSDYAGGLGTESYPYLIATPEQMLNVINAKSGYRHFRLINDLDMTSLEARVYDGAKFYVGKNYPSGNTAAPFLYEHTIDGDNHSIYLADDVSFVGSMRDTTIKNVTFHMNGRSSISLESEEASKLINVITRSEKGVKLTNNESIFIRCMKAYNSSFTFTDVKNYADITSDATETNYNGIFVGCATTGLSSRPCTVTVNNFENYGNIALGKVALVGNVYSAGFSKLVFKLNDLKNFAYIRSFYAPSNQYVATNTSKTIEVTIDNVKKTTENTVLTGFVCGSDSDTLSITKNSDGTLSIIASNNSNVSYYVVSIGIYTRISTEETSGTNQIAVCEKIDKFDGTKSTILKVLGFINNTEVSESQSLSGIYSSRGENTIKFATVNGTEYYVLNVDGELVSGVVQPQDRMITVTAYDASGMPIASAVVGQ